MPEKTSVNSVMKRYKEYIDRLNDKFRDLWKESRDVDRALWTYGHMFFIKWKIKEFHYQHIDKFHVIKHTNGVVDIVHKHKLDIQKRILGVV